MKNQEIIHLEELSLSEYSDWKVVCSKLNKNYLIKNQSSFEKEIGGVISYVIANPLRDSFRWFVEIGTIQYTIGVFLTEKSVYIGSKNLSKELTLVSQFEAELNDTQARYFEFLQKITTLPLENSPTIIEFISHKEKLPLFNEGRFENIHEQAHKLGSNLVEKIKRYNSSLFEKFSDYGLNLTANYMLIRIHLLKFLAILPNLDHDKHGDEVKRIFVETITRLIDDSTKAKIKNLQGQEKCLPRPMELSLKLIIPVIKIIPASTLAKLLRFSVAQMAKRFIAGTDIVDAEKSLNDLLASGRSATIDQLGELVVSNKEADEYTDKVINIIRGLGVQIPRGSKNSAGINLAHVSIKVSALCNDFKPQDFDYTYGKIAPRLKKILLAGKEHQVFVNIDAEHYHYRDKVFEVYSKVLIETEELHDWGQTGIVVQAYLRDGINHLYDVYELAKKRGVLMPIRLVKGAYWDAETIEADAHNFTAPEFLNKEETDIHFRQIIFKALELGEFIQLAVASHNLQDHCFSEALRSATFPNSPVIEHQCLHMTYEGLSVALSKMGWPTRNYIPVGNLLVGMAYLVRRIMENSSQVGVLTIMRSHKNAIDRKTPTQKLKLTKKNFDIVRDEALSVVSSDFKNIYPIRTYLKHHLARVSSALSFDMEKLKNNQLYLNDEDGISLHCPSDPSLVLGKIKFSSTEEVELKTEKLFENFQNGINKSERFVKLLTLSELMLQEREELTSLIMLEAGKTIDEAIADVDEAIDFINFYLKEHINSEQQDQKVGRGVVGVIAPWNFPLAIACGMTVAPYVCGNNVILKPSENTSLVGKKLEELMRKSGIEEEEVAVVYGAGEIGQHIVNQELIVGIVFTGSKAVGEKIYKQLSNTPIHSRYGFEGRKFVIAEMGGKNAIIVTKNCELDETVSGIIYSAFAHSGQKCSAASRVIIDNSVREAFILRFKEAVMDIKVGGATDLSTMINPLVTQKDKKRLQELALQAQKEGRVIVDRSQEEYDSYCVGPVVVELSADIPREGTLARKEIFGPMIHLIPYETLDEAISIFNETEYALTGGLFCQSQDDIDYILPRLEAGNIYVNRPNTGARVAIEPFGGFKLSGTGPKAGSAQYLKQFIREDIKTTVDEFTPFENTDSKFNLVKSSGLGTHRRIEILAHCYKKFMEQYDSFSVSLDEEEKAKFKEEMDMFFEFTSQIESEKFENRYIPGQLSFDMKDQISGNILIVDSKSDPKIETFKLVFMNLLIGNGVNIISLNKSNSEVWHRFYNHLFNNGVSSYNFGFDELSEIKLKNILTDENYHSVTFTSLEDSFKFRESILDNMNNQWLHKIYVQEDTFKIADVMDRYINRRSFAINTMRHGAPLELNI